MNLRADATRNRAALIAAAELIFAQNGANAPLQLVAKEAGVGRGTLYRHFPDRAALVFAVFEGRIIELESLNPRDSKDPMLAEQILISMLDTQTRTPGLVTTLLGVDKYTKQLAQLTARIVDYLEEPISKAKAADRIQKDITARDFLAIWSMFGWISSSPNQNDIALQTARSRSLLLRSLLTPTAYAEY